METDELAIEFWGPKSIPDAVQPKGSRRRYPRVDISSRVPYTVDPEEPESAPAFFENTTYYVLAHCKKEGKNLSIKHRDVLIQDAFNPSLANPNVVSGTFSFGNQVGLSTFSFLVNDNPHLAISIEVFPTKLDYEDDYWNLITEVSRHVYNLTFEYLRSTYQYAGPVFKTEHQTDLEWLILLEHIMADLERAVYQIARQPNRSMALEPVNCLAAQIRRPDRFVRSAIRRSMNKGLSYSARINGFSLPSRLLTARAQPNLDTQENRLIRHELELIRRRLADLHGHVQKVAISTGQKRYKESALRISNLKTKVNRFLRLEPFVSATGSPPSSYSVLVFRSAPGYREAFRCCLTLRLGFQIQADALKLPLKDMAELYEYWCVLALLEIMSVGSGGTYNPRNLIEAGPGGLSLRLRKGRHLFLELRRQGRTICTLRYNPRIPSATGEQRPDILLSFHPQGWETPIEVVLDAKYKIVGNSDYVKKYGTPGPPEDAINQLYRYRDAIVDKEKPPRRRIVEALALFPYKESIDQQFSSNRLYRSLDEVGIGALPFLPSETAYVEDWLRKNVRRSGSHFAERTVGVLLRDEQLLNHAKMAEVLLVAVVRYGKIQWDWMLENQLYFAPLRKIGRQRRLDIEWLGFFEPAAMIGEKYGAVRFVSRVLHIDVVTRSQIHTPWASKRNPDEPYLLFHIDKPEQLPRPIQNTDGHRIVFRWGTRYSLEHASTMSELYLETEPERRLWEELRHAGIPFTTKAGRVSAIDPEDPSGRTTFILKQETYIRYQGSGLFQVFSKNGTKTHSFAFGELRNHGPTVLLATIHKHAVLSL